MNLAKQSSLSNSESVAIGIIPARWGSTRFPGKSLTLILGRPLIEWVVRQAKKCHELSDVWVATDDDRIRKTAEALGVRAVMTRADHPSGTDRVAEAVAGYACDVVVNIQGDEPMIDPALIDAIARVLRETPEWDMATAASPITTEHEVTNPSVVKVVTDATGGALYFSRSAIPYVRDSKPNTSEPLYWRHIGIYGYRRTFLERLVRQPPCVLEEAEKLEQLRALYLGARIRVIRAQSSGFGVDTPDDVPKIEAAMKQAGWCP